MNSITDLIKKEIEKQYKSVRQFALSIDVPPTTVASALKIGVDGTSFDTVMKMCNALNIKFIDNSIPIKLGQDAIDFLAQYNELDAIGKHTIMAVLNAEYSRCCSNDIYTGQAAAFGGQTISVNRNSKDIKTALDAVRKIKKDRGK